MKISVLQSNNLGKVTEKDTTWPKFLDRLRKAVILHDVTMQQYKSMTKEQRFRCKNRGGYVGAVFNGSQRVRTKVLHRTLLTLDIDGTDEDVWDDYVLMHDEWKTVMHTTCSSTPESFRCRIIMPFSRNVTVEEYEPIARMVATWFDINATDTTGYSIHHLMFWPVYCADAEVVFKYQEGRDLDPDYVLSLYGDKDWHDPDNWPRTEKEQRDDHRRAEKMEDPRAKRGLVGEFCRCYSITDAISTFLNDVYEPCFGKEDRFSYSHSASGSAGGLVIYNDTYAYSHHQSDPIGGRCVNSFDLVRLHLFGDKDDYHESDGVDVDITRQPSFKAMLEMCEKDTVLQRFRDEEREQRIKEDFGDLTDMEGEEQSEDDTGWQSELEHRKGNRGELKPNIGNVRRILEHDPHLKGCLALDEFGYRPVCKRDLPWRSVKGTDDWWSEDDDSNLRNYLEEYWQYEGGRDKIYDALRVVCMRHAFHPVRQYLSGLEWDGVERLDTMLIRYGGADDNEYTRTVTRKWMVGAVKRVMEPGCKMDNLLVLIGKQGIGKSSICRILAKDIWFNDSVTKLEKDKDVIATTQGSWIIELAELASMKKSQLDAAKAFITSQEDIARFAYDRRTTRVRRQCIFIATTNEDVPFNDMSGNRRYWPVRCHALDRGLVNRELPGEVDQLWAEAVVRWRDGESLWLEDDRIAEMAENVQQSATVEDDDLGILQQYLDMPVPEDYMTMTVQARRDWFQSYLDGDAVTKADNLYLRQAVCIKQIRVEMMGEDIAKLGGKDYTTTELGRKMKRLDGWLRVDGTKRCEPYGVQRWFIRENVKPEEMFDLIPAELC